jgi:putative membrane protein
MWWNGGWGAGQWIWMFLMMFGFWAVVVAAVVFGFRALRRDVPPPVDRARAILDERFARGELDEEEYRRRRAVLGAS